jgi:hypothetical protein
VPEEPEENAERKQSVEPAVPMIRRSQRLAVDMSQDMSDQNVLAQGRRSTRERRPPVEWWKGSPDVEHADITRSTDAHEDPQTFSEAINSSDSGKWKAAIEEEYQSLIQNQTWELVPKPKDRNIVSCKWVFKTKLGSDGHIERYKARLVARGFTQVEGVDYQETYSPVVKMTSIRILLSIVAIFDLELHQMDVKTAFLNGKLDEEIYMQQPEGFTDNTQLVCKLHKTLYGLKQSPRVWYQTIDAFFQKLGYKRIESDYGLYVLWTDEVKCIISLYVDDLLLACNNVSHLSTLKEKLNKEYDMKDLGEASYILGIKVIRNRSAGHIYLSQENYIDQVLTKFRMDQCNPVSTPVDSNFRYVNDEESPPVDSKLYQRGVGSLMYAMTCTRPDLAFAVSLVSRFAANPKEIHWSMLKRILKYLKGTKNCCLRLGRAQNQGPQNLPLTLKGYADADWGSDTQTRKSTTGYLFFLGDGAISWCSKRQATVALSTAEAEYMASSAACQEILWLKSLLDQIGFKLTPDLILFNDNQSAIALSKNPGNHNRTKHIDMRYHFIREAVAMDKIKIKYCSTKFMLADILTKGMPRPRHEELIEEIGLEKLGNVGVLNE